MLYLIYNDYDWRDYMKDNILLFVIGVLLGAIITTGAFFTYTVATNSSKCDNQTMQMGGGQPPEMPNGQQNQNGQPPELPSGQQGQQNPNDQASNNSAA